MTRPFLHFVLFEANAPNLPFWKVSSQLNMPGSFTDSVKVMAPVLELRVTPRAVKLLSGVRVGVRVGMSVDVRVGVSVDVEVDVDVGAAPTAKDCCVCGAGSYWPLPAWLASIVHVPTAMKLTVAPATEHTAGV